LFISEKNLLLGKQALVHDKKTRGTGTEVTQKQHEKKRNAASNLCWKFVQDPCLIVFENGGCAWNRSSWRSHMKIGLFLENFPSFMTHHVCLAKMAKSVYKNTRQSVGKYQSRI